MEAIGLFFAKFSDELLSAQISMTSFALALSVYWMLIRKKKRETAEWVPAALVRAYLDRVRHDERDTRYKLFGEDFASSAPQMPLTQMLQGGATTQTVTQVISNDPALQKEIEALRAQLVMADSRSMEFDKSLNGLKAEKAALEEKLKNAPAAAAGGGVDPKLTKELEELRAKLAEYEVIEDDLANLKKFQKENEALKQRISALEAGGPTAVVAGGAQATAAPASVSPTKIDTPTTVVSATPAAAPAPAATPAAPAAETNTNVLAPVTPSVEDKPAAPASSKQKEEELLSEFEKMLAS